MQVAPLDPAFAPLTDVYFRGYDQNYPDVWRYNEWKREFDQYVAQGNLPSLSHGCKTPATTFHGRQQFKARTKVFMLALISRLQQKRGKPGRQDPVDCEKVERWQAE